MMLSGFVKYLPKEESNTEYPREENKDLEMNPPTTNVLKATTKPDGLLSGLMHGYKTTGELP